ncbi:MAG: HRDC domain-containing protein [Treponema sp.]|nr:HRDC domain-containing protein [Treponema sp.]
MPLLTQFATFFLSPFSEPSATAELNNFLKSHRIINVEKRLIDGERGTGWVFLVEYSDNEGTRSSYTMSSKVDWRDVLNPSQFAVYDLLRKKRKEIGDRTKMPLYGILSNEQLALMAQNPPRTKEDFLKIKGVNETKYKQWGETFIKTIEQALLSVEVYANAEISTGSITANTGLTNNKPSENPAEN